MHIAPKPAGRELHATDRVAGDGRSPECRRKAGGPSAAVFLGDVGGHLRFHRPEPVLASCGGVRAGHRAQPESRNGSIRYPSGTGRSDHSSRS